MSPDPADLLLQLALAAPMFGLALIVHELCHALAASRLASFGTGWEGRLTLDPRAHLDPVGSVAMPVLGLTLGWWQGVPGLIFGWARPVAVDPDGLGVRRRDVMLVALAGPLANVALVVVFALAVRGGVAAGVPLESDARFLFALAGYGIYLNALLAVFNALPLPPLDGSRVLAFFLGEAVGRRLLALPPSISLIAIVGLLVTGRLSEVLLGAIHLGERLAGVPIARLLY